MGKDYCYFCGSECNKVKRPGAGASDTYDCNYCGEYEITYRTLSDFDDKLKDNRHIFAGYLEETKENRKEPIVITSDEIDLILNDIRVPKTTIEKLEKILLYCYDRNEYVGQEFTTDNAYQSTALGNNRIYINGYPRRIGIAYTKDTYELNGLIDAMGELSWLRVKYTPSGDNLVSFVLTAKGLQYAEQLSKTNINSKKVFVAMGFRDDYQERLSQAIKPACKDCGFDAFIVSDNEFNNSIIDEMLVGIKTSKFLITDLTYNNCGAYYEAGYAHGMGLEVIKCCSKQWFDEKDENERKINKLHFDVIADNLILYENYDDFKRKLKARIRATIDGATLVDEQ